MTAWIPTVIALVIPCQTLFAQWPSWPAAGAPRTANGKVDFSAPATKAPDGHPDLSGVWDRGSAPGTPTSPPTPPPGGFGATPPPGPRPFQNLPSLLPDGLPFQPWALELRKQRLAENSKDHPDAHCLPLHPVQLHSHPQPRKIIQTPGMVLIIYEANDGLRQIFTDGRPLPADAEPWWFGYSSGKWEGDTLVVESVKFRDLGWLDVEGSPLTESGKIIERFRRPDFGHLKIQVTIDDPKAYTKPWTVTVYQRIMLDTDLIEFVCQENSKDDPHLR